ncbi:arginyltransferase KNAG_0D03320 [Huiozyma naganishii CBS 8797]|uniref:arginyltransferase n=1 Tax=Huiozyma naganishii (strain ATCC MYA-139 / BCRC 22969 / CBS 8797 / KCTC 17520 / NBRC 10181 / NCYC 3082 / Yp74L-3) TaxID=1071383 RepID=J7RKP9_HUIN7|nr:hypothetical protein KNAG_0D03320 [Kazachstania naganishii CBS 8797]CCK70078.1 hypothetical protein KNAG_0D03320 [Kazachstania naganishii CBS 8797]
MNLSERLIVTQPWYFSDEAQKCGYCKGGKSLDSGSYQPLQSWEADDPQRPNSSTVGFQCELMSVETYDMLCNSGFRRSGKFIYKLDPLRSCCRTFSIRTTPDQVKVTKDLKSCVKRFCKTVEPIISGSDSNGKQFDYVEKLLGVTQNSASRFKTVFTPPVYTEEKYALFAKYQEFVHKDYDHNRRSFERFLCHSPFSAEVEMGTLEEWEQLNNWWKLSPNEALERIGPSHECYYLDGKLIALAVTDFLPSGVSSVYFIWDPCFKKLSLGKLSALRELTIVSRTNKKYYYLGYYIEDCDKMNYKAQYGGELLDIVMGGYVPLKYLHETGDIDRGHFFVASDKARPDYQEFPINEQFTKARPTLAVPNCNMAELLYGKPDGQALKQDISGYISTLNQYNIDFVLDDGFQFKGRNEDGKSSDLPNIMPGLVSLWELLKIIESGQINELNGKLMVYDLGLNRIRPVLNVMAEDREYLRAIVNLVRLIGLEMTKKAMLIA